MYSQTQFLPMLALGTVVLLPAHAIAQTQFATDCALKELPVITLIEAQGEAGNVSGDRLATASLTMLEARTACAEGRVKEALSLYQSILDLGPAQVVAKGEISGTASK